VIVFRVDCRKIGKLLSFTRNGRAGGVHKARGKNVKPALILAFGKPLWLGMIFNENILTQAQGIEMIDQAVLA
jgi:hypothetical protein